MKAIFLSDVHLKRRSDPGYQKCMQLFACLRGRGVESGHSGDANTIVIDLLVIAGDFFDFWFEKEGRIYPEFRPVVESLVQLRQSGIRICLCEGNHDFFLADYFSGKLGIEVYPGDAEFMLDGLRSLVSHGDTVDRKNRRYLALRRLLRSSFAYRLQRVFPLRWLWWIARFSSKVSKDRTGDATDRLIEVMHRFAVEKCREGFDAVILGHCHAPSYREEQIGGRRRIIVTLGDWITHHDYLLYENGRFTLNRFLPGG
ncbi:MAG: UDP-2,3-diacylglucosamine diphosphatase [Deltaproteobacteria bacterium]|nr:UDP-2,3-diacylglucosamine diphosphatase [Deltaproteobacteria bacterium]